MYPYLRLFIEMRRTRTLKPLPVTGTHRSCHRCLPWDLDPWNELNNGRTLTLFDLGRLPLIHRTGLARVCADKGWGLTVAGSSLRYRRRVVLFDRLDMVSRCLGWDGRFFYIEQSLWRKGECTSHMLLRAAVTSRAGIVPPPEVADVLGAGDSPPLPDWVAGWIEADALRPWPPAH
ncbi:acyl-CoA thioesterase FadM [Cereibacter ovatus]|uniref:Acyl-CoA thioesterase FadM n=1 Tax=Cereibacter ovatus TaxID=439529 RepID=A0A285CQ35_9RHOB|nr:acyl-CoA thioesterase [Cereibacter ovatus]SNX69662.1 acyl-CoA thioesterase FadM [Cereibacter ovatus]